MFLATATKSPKVGDPLTFYSTAATIIVVLFLAVAYQTHYLRPVKPRSEHKKDRERLLGQFALAAVAMTVAAIGETSALRVLVKQHVTIGDRHKVLSALILLGAAVVFAPVLSTMIQMPDEPRGNYRILIWGWTGMVVLVTVFGLLNVNDVG